MVLDVAAEVSVFPPSKLIEYVGVGRPIFGIMPLGTADALIGRLGGWVDSLDIEAIPVALKHFIPFGAMQKTRS